MPENGGTYRLEVLLFMGICGMHVETSRCWSPFAAWDVRPYKEITYSKKKHIAWSYLTDEGLGIHGTGV